MNILAAALLLVLTNSSAQASVVDVACEGKDLNGLSVSLESHPVQNRDVDSYVVIVRDRDELVYPSRLKNDDTENLDGETHAKQKVYRSGSHGGMRLETQVGPEFHPENPQPPTGKLFLRDDESGEWEVITLECQWLEEF